MARGEGETAGRQEKGGDKVRWQKRREMRPRGDKEEEDVGKKKEARERERQKEIFIGATCFI